MSAFLFGETNVSRLTEATSAAAALRSKGGNSQSSSSASKARRASASAASASTDLFDLDQLRLLGRRRSQQEDTVRPRQGHLRKARLSQSGTLGSPLPSLAAQGPPPVGLAKAVAALLLISLNPLISSTLLVPCPSHTLLTPLTHPSLDCFCSVSYPFTLRFLFVDLCCCRSARLLVSGGVPSRLEPCPAAASAIHVTSL